MRRYECVVVMDPEVPDDDVRLFTERFGNVIKTGGGEIIKIEDWGLKRLAYLVRKKERGRYILFDFVGVPKLITEMERQLKIADEVMKFLSVKLDEDVDLEAFKAASQEAEPAEPPAAPETPKEPEATEEVAETGEAPVPEAAAEAATPIPDAALSEAPNQGEAETKKEGEQV
jgi:small subunit ribosomal protein S6